MGRGGLEKNKHDNTGHSELQQKKERGRKIVFYAVHPCVSYQGGKREIQRQRVTETETETDRDRGRQRQTDMRQPSSARGRERKRRTERGTERQREKEKVVLGL